MFSADDQENVDVFWKAMHTISAFTDQELGRTLDLTPRHRLLDLGGGSGTYGIELCRIYPDLSVTSYDLPHVSTMAAGNIEEAGMSDRVSVLAGDFFADAYLATRTTSYSRHQYCTTGTKRPM
ncbi:methyltransferase [Amycolatopsis sp. NPDC004378]